MWKTQKIDISCDCVKFQRRRVNVIDTRWGCIYFLNMKISDENFGLSMQSALLWVLKGSYFVFGSLQEQAGMRVSSKNTFIVL